jgi:AraC-like DNA-binding protein
MWVYDFRIGDMKKTLSAQYYSRAGSLTGLDVLARELGKPVEPMLKRFGFSMASFDDPEASISYNAFCDLVETCGDEWNCPDFGLRFGAKQNLNMFGPVGLVTRLTATVGEALRALQVSMAIHSGGYDSYLELGDAANKQPAAAVFMPKQGSGAKRHSVELSLAVVLNILVMISGISRFKPVRVEFQHKAPTDTGPAQRFFNCPIYYGASINALYFDAELLTRPTEITDHAYAPVVKAYLERARRLTEEDVVAVTKQLIAKLTSTGRCSREVVAEFLHLTPKTLQRRLADKGVTFAALLDEYRHNKALELVREQAMPLLQIALALGYSDQSSFNQAFRRWTDATPSSFQPHRLS